VINVSLLAIPIALAGNASVMLGYVLQKKATETMEPIENCLLPFLYLQQYLHTLTETFC